MTDVSRHAWISLIDVSGPFLAEPVLERFFPQGLGQVDPLKARTLRQAYAEWREAIDENDPDLKGLHAAWIELVLKQGLELDEDGHEDVLRSAAKLADTLAYTVPGHAVTLRPDFAVVDDREEGKARLLIKTYEPGIGLDDALRDGGWATSPAERMVELCRASNVRLGLVTNGERWMLVDAPVGAVTTFASWYARLWGQEPVTLQAFVSLLGIRRFFVDQSERLPALLDESLKLQDEVTDALGEQVRRAVEVLIQSLDRADVDRNRELLKGVEPAELYEAGLTVMMRIVFLLSAEERGLLLLGDERYEANYAVSSLRMQLRSESEEILERRWDAWSRLLSLFRAVYGGVEHEALRLPALGGSLFDPDRFQFLEGRPRASNWITDPASPLPIDNRTVLLLLDAVQLFRGRTLSYRALDVEQIGYVYEGLLERTVVRAIEVTLDLDATKGAKKPWVTLNDLETAGGAGAAAVETLLKDRTGSSASRVRNDLSRPVDEPAADRLLTACHGDPALRDRIRPYYHFLRTDRWDYPLVYPKGTFMVATGADRRETGTHYTPKSLTEAIVKDALEPVVYIGPADGKPRDEWRIKSPAELLDLKVCDPAMGSGAFLVQACRWLSERLVESWQESERQGRAVTADGEVVEDLASAEPLRRDIDERLLTARRLIAERCLYGVDVNPLAVELAKLSIWLVTLAKERPFGFLDHNLRHGDSLLGIQSLEQLKDLDMSPGPTSTGRLFAQNIDQAIEQAIELRSSLRTRPIRDIRDVEVMARLDEAARRKVDLAELIADALVGEALAASGKRIDTTPLSIEAGGAMNGDQGQTDALRRRGRKGLGTGLLADTAVRQPFHWPLQFPEVFSRDDGGFDAIVGNPPFLGGKKIAGILSRPYLNYLISIIGNGVKGSADLIAFFFLLAAELVRPRGCLGLIAVNSISEGGTREVGLDQVRSSGNSIYCAVSGQVWPGSANVVTSRVHVYKGKWQGAALLDGLPVKSISSYLSDRENWEPVKLESNNRLVHQGSVTLGKGFIIDEREAAKYIQDYQAYNEVLFPYLSGQDVNSHPAHASDRWVINFWDWDEGEAESFAKPLFERLRKDVLTERREMKSMGGAADTFWRHLWYRSELYHLIGMGKHFRKHPDYWDSNARKPEQLLVFATGATKYPCFTFVANQYIYANTVCVVVTESTAVFACLSSDIHTIWAWEHGSRMKQDLRYTHGDIFETFPFPDGVLEGEHQTLTALGKAFLEKRCQYMTSNNKGMTKVYNDVHDPTLHDEDIKGLRALQVGLNDAVLDAYGFSDINPEYGFHEVGYLPRDRNVRFTVSEAARDEVLRRLASLNKERYERESVPGAARKETAKLNSRDGGASDPEPDPVTTSAIVKRNATAKQGRG